MSSKGDFLPSLQLPAQELQFPEHPLIFNNS
jgi:hypothetical protein